MIDKTSRYANVAVRTWVSADGVEVRLLDLREVPRTPAVFVIAPGVAEIDFAMLNDRVRPIRDV